ncbi:MAG: hypothetical protein J5639_09230 [Bacteroidales bacterium]|nr:hypothetical protein [Bacteroidales bacterium]
MIYINYETLCKDIRNNLWKIPHDVCGVVGVPRSGMLAASIIAEYLNVGLASLDAMITDPDALRRHGGRRLRQNDGNKLLIVDDTCYWGNAKKVCEDYYFNTYPIFEKYEITYLVVYLEGPCTKAKPDIWLRDIREEAATGPFGWAIYEWNLFAHGRLTARTLFDLDGVICQEPPDERDVDKYVEYIKHPVPLFVPTVNNINICTYRLNKYHDETWKFLDSLGYNGANIVMASDRVLPAWEFKAGIYRDPHWMLFVESSDWQARRIHEATGKPVISIETNKVYG